MAIRFGSVPVPVPVKATTQGRGPVSMALAIGGQSNITLTFDKEMPDTDYSVISVYTEGTVGIGSLAIVLPLVSKSKTGCVATVKNYGLVALGAGATVVVTVEKMS